MSDPIELPIDPDDQLYDPPLVDCIYFDQQQRGFAITFIPSDDASPAMTEFIFIASTAPDYQRVMTFWKRIESLLISQAQIARIVHSGGGNYTFHFVDDSVIELTAVSDIGQSTEISDRLKQIADAAQIAFLDQSYTPLAPHEI